MNSKLKEILECDIPEIKLDLKLSRPGIKHSFDLYDGYGNIMVEANTPLTDFLIKNLLKNGIEFLYYNPTADETKKLVSKLNINKSLIDEEIQDEVLVYTKEIYSFIREIFDFNPDGRISSQRISKARDIVNMVIENIEKNADGIFKPLAKLKSLDDYTFLHSSYVSFVAAILGTKLKFSKDLRIRMGVGGLLHDIGKSTISKKILLKKGKLTPREFDIIKKHPKNGYDLIEDNDNIYTVEKNIVLLHHEKPDRSGYPFGYDYSQYRKKIPRVIRLMSICDVYSALINKRSYKDPFPSEKALRIIFNSIYAPFKNSYQFLYSDVRDFIKAAGLLLNNGEPFLKKGDVFRLNTGEIGIVDQVNEVYPLDPRIKVICTRDMKKLKRELAINLLNDSSRQIVHLFDINTSAGTL